MFDWLGDIFSGIGDLLGDALASLGESISNSIFDAILKWWYEMIYTADPATVEELIMDLYKEAALIAGEIK